MNPELRIERDGASFPVHEMTDFLYGKEKVERIKYFQEIITKDPIFRKFQEDKYYLDRPNLVKKSLAIMLYMLQKISSLGLKKEGALFYSQAGFFPPWFD